MTYTRVHDLTQDLSEIYRRNWAAMAALCNSTQFLDTDATRTWCEANTDRLIVKRGREWTLVSDDWYVGSVPSHAMDVVHESTWIRRRRRAWVTAGHLQWVLARDTATVTPATFVAAHTMSRMDVSGHLTYGQIKTVSRIASDAALAELVRELIPEKTYTYLMREWRSIRDANPLSDPYA